MNRCAIGLGAAAGAVLVAACAGLNTLSADVASFGDWPPGRAPSTYAFERLPSQQAQGEAQNRLEAAARPALATAGFRSADGGGDPDVIVQLGARVTRTGVSPWDDPLWWHGGFGHWRRGPWIGPRWGYFAHPDFPRYEREVALLIRDRASGKPLYEARASSDGTSAGGDAVLRAMFDAALKDFPAAGPNPRQVTVPLAP